MSVYRTISKISNLFSVKNGMTLKPG